VAKVSLILLSNQ